MRLMDLVNSVVEQISQGRLLQKIVALALKVLVGITAILTLMATVGLIGEVVDSIGRSPAAALGLLFFLLSFLLAAVLVICLLLFRAKTISALEAGSYPVAQLVALLMRLIGEIYAVVGGTLSIGTGLMLWFEVRHISFYPLLQLLPHMRSFFPVYEASFLAGLSVMLGGLLLALAHLIAFYLLAELIRLLLEIAHNTRKAG